MRVIVGMLGFPQEDADIFRHFIHQILEDVDLSLRGAAGRGRRGELDDYIDARIAEHLAEPRDDLTSFLLDAEIDGSKLPSGAHPGHHDPADDRRHRHHLVGDRRVALAPGPASRRPPAAWPATPG